MMRENWQNKITQTTHPAAQQRKNCARALRQADKGFKRLTKIPVCRIYHFRNEKTYKNLRINYNKKLPKLPLPLSRLRDCGN